MTKHLPRSVDRRGIGQAAGGLALEAGVRFPPADRRRHGPRDRWIDGGAHLPRFRPVLHAATIFEPTRGLTTLPFPPPTLLQLAATNQPSRPHHSQDAGLTRAWECEVRRRHRRVPDCSETGSAASAPRKRSGIFPQGLDGNVRLRGGAPAHVQAPTGLPGSSHTRSAAPHPLQRPLSAAAELQWAFDRQRRRGASQESRRARRRAHRQRTQRRPGPRRWTIRRRIPRRPQRRAPPIPSRRWCLMRQEGRNWSRTRPARAHGRSAACWPTWTRSWRCRPTGCARSATAATS